MLRVRSRWLAAAIVLVASAASAQPAGEQARRGSHVWLARPWDIRYVVVVEADFLFRRAQARAARINAASDSDLFRREEFFDAAHLPVGGATATTDLAVALIEFDRSGRVITPYRHRGPLRGRINRMRYVTLSAGGPDDRIFALGEWFTGRGDASTHWAPAVCDSDEMPDPPGVSDGSSYRYGSRFTHPELTGTFGCREWAFQLYDLDRPYIDVTSYQLIKDGRVTSTSIHVFIGFARFGDAKPVIGRQRTEWYCLLECPGGAAPGHIADIAAWTGDAAGRCPSLRPVPPLSPIRRDGRARTETKVLLSCPMSAQRRRAACARLRGHARVLPADRDP